MRDISGIHHITAICGNAQENLDFYSGLLGMRLVKKSVNQDDPGTYHLFYADADGHPGTDLTFFPFRDSPPGRLGHGIGAEIALAVPARTLTYWHERLTDHGVATAADTRRGDRAMTFRDPHGQQLALVEASEERLFRAWDKSPVPMDKQIVGLHAVRAWERELAPTAAFLTGTLGFSDFGAEDGWHRFGVDAGGSGKHIELREMPNSSRGHGASAPCTTWRGASPMIRPSLPSANASPRRIAVRRK
ncbi:MAG: VOC family protein [Gemmatimonadaceae bacterium]